MRTLSFALFMLVAAGAARADVVVYYGVDPGAEPSDPRPNSDRTAAEFRDAVLGEIRTIGFEDQPLGSFTTLEVAPGVVVEAFSQSTNAAGIRNDGSRIIGYNTTVGGEKFLRFDAASTGASYRVSFDPPLHAFGAYLTGVGTASGDVFVEFDDGAFQSLEIAGASNGGSLYLGVTDHATTIRAVLFVIRNGSSDVFGIDDFSYVGSCSGQERVQSDCLSSMTVRTNVSRGVHGAFVEGYLDEERRRQRDFGAQGEAQMEWADVAEGAHVIRVVTGCGAVHHDYVYCGPGDCTGDETLSQVECADGQTLTARVIDGVPGEIATFYLNGDLNQIRTKAFNADGNVNVTWPNAGRGDHVVTAVMTCGTVLEETVACAGQDCTGDETMTARCSSLGTVKAELTDGVPGEAILLHLDGLRPRNRTFNFRGIARTKWADVPVGSHEVTAELSCGDVLTRQVTCR
ncbi:MAG: hypothetical protein FLDDKLPJ_00367 [Phycisphaerae bacterium]|nr:hypothetical protein [Phycisphaerae bacterium]